jgi:hypothetical protein
VQLMMSTIREAVSLTPYIHRPVRFSIHRCGRAKEDVLSGYPVRLVYSLEAGALDFGGAWGAHKNREDARLVGVFFGILHVCTCN